MVVEYEVIDDLTLEQVIYVMRNYKGFKFKTITIDLLPGRLVIKKSNETYEWCDEKNTFKIYNNSDISYFTDIKNTDVIIGMTTLKWKIYNKSYTIKGENQHPMFRKIRLIVITIFISINTFNIISEAKARGSVSVRSYSKPSTSYSKPTTVKPSPQLNLNKTQTNINNNSKSPRLSLNKNYSSMYGYNVNYNSSFIAPNISVIDYII